MDRVQGVPSRDSLFPAYIGWVLGFILVAVGMPMAWSLGVVLVPLGLITIAWVTLRAHRRRITGLIVLILAIAVGFAIIQLTWEASPTVQILPFQ